MTDAIRRCVIADDVRAWRELLAAWLTEWGYDCVLTGDGDEARAAVEAAPTHLLITDIEMPKCSGLELLSRMRNHPQLELRRVPIIVISSLQDDELADVIGLFGGNCLLSKPLERARVEIAVRHLERGDRISALNQFNPAPERLTSTKVISPKLRRLAEEAIQKKAAQF